MDKKECTKGKNSLGKMIIALMLILGLGAGQVVAQNEVTIEKTIPKDSLSLSISDSIAVSDSLSHPRNSFIFDKNRNKSVGLSVYDTPSPYANSVGSIEELIRKERM